LGEVIEMVYTIAGRASVALAAVRATLIEAEEGQTYVEYALLITFIALVALVAVKVLGTSISSLFSSVAAAF
jgi:Flp pilus assembly pilin Flp